MRNRWPLLLALPVLLGSAVFWASDAAWKKQEYQFHLAVHEWLRHGVASTRVYSNCLLLRYEEHQIAFFDESANSLLAIDQMKLIASSSPRPQNKPLIFISMSSGGSVDPWGFYLAEPEDRGWIEIPEPNMIAWKSYELSPETCQALKQRIYGLRKKVGIVVEPK